MSRRGSLLEQSLLVVMIVTMLAAVSLFIALGCFNRYMADDYCYAAALNQGGFVRAQVNNYLFWSGRFTYAAVMSAIESIGPMTASIGPPLCLTLWVIASFWTLYQITRLNGCSQPFLMTGLGATLIVFAMLNVADSLVQSSFWEAGYLLYTIPLVLATIYIGMVAFAVRKQIRGRLATSIMILGGMMTLVAGGINEPFTISQLLIHVLALSVCYHSPRGSARKRSIPYLIAGLIGATIALVIMVSAPGNRVRQSLFPVPRDFLTVVTLTARGTCGFILRKMIQAPATTISLCLIPAYVAVRHHQSHRAVDAKSTWRRLLLLTLIGFLLVFACYLPGVYGANGLVARARFIPQFVFVCTAIGSGFLVGTLISDRLPRMSKSALSAALSIITAITVLAGSRAIWRAA